MRPLSLSLSLSLGRGGTETRPVLSAALGGDLILFVGGKGWLFHPCVIRLMSMCKWEYTSNVVATGTIVQFCNTKGKDGWEVCGVTLQGNGDTILLLFKRPKS
jgi:hypothetical protein